MEYSILELSKIIHKILKIKTPIDENITYIEDRPFNDKRYYISNEKLKKLGWEITKTLHEGLKELI